LQSGEDGGFIVEKATLRGIGDGKVKEQAAILTMLGQRQSQAILGEVPIDARGKHGECIVQEMRPEVQVGGNEIADSSVATCD